MNNKPTLLGGAFNHDDGPRISDATTGEAAILMKEFGIDPAGPLVPRWMALAQALAKKYHPDFRGPVGRPKHKTIAYYAMLIGSIEWEKERRKLPSFKAALAWLYENQPSLLIGSLSKAPLPSLGSLYSDFKTARSMKKSGFLW